MKPRTAGGYFALFITSTIWGTTWVASKIGVNEMPALELSGIRQFIAGVLFLIFFLLIKRERIPSPKNLLWSFFIGMLMFGIANGLSTWSLDYIPSGFSALMGALYPLMVVIIERIFYKIKVLNPLTLTGLILGLAGIVMVFYDNAFHSFKDGFFLGVILSFLAMLSWSIGTVFLIRKKSEMDPYHSIGWQMFFSGIVIYAASFIADQHIPISKISVLAWEMIWYLVVFGSVIGYVAFIYTIRYLPVALASLYAYINPLVAIGLAAILVDEKITKLIVIGSTITLLGVFLVNLSIRRARNINAKPD